LSARISVGFYRRHPVRVLVARRPVAAYLVLACATSWAWWLPMALTGSVARPGVGWPTHLPGLVGPALAALAVTAVVDGKAGLAELASRVVRWRVGWWLWAVVVGTASVAVVNVLIMAAMGQPLPALAAFERYTGIGSVGLAAVIGISIVVNGLGEETGWRGFAAHRLLPHRGPLVASLIVALMWAIWHLPLFWVVESFRSFGPAMIVGWLFGLLAGSIVLTFLYRRSGLSILLVAAWHTAFNLTSATEATSGVGAAMASSVVIIAALVIAIGWFVGGRRGARTAAVPGDQTRP
jgi:membrane protease YdiL (CAAX protease family)